MADDLKEFVNEQLAADVRSPADVIPVDSRAELQAQLDFYGIPLFRFDQTFERRFFMENVRPALRYYCLKLGVDVPEWLADETHFGHGDGDEEMFGPGPLDPATWDQWMFEEIGRAHDPAEGEEEAEVEE